MTNLEPSGADAPVQGIPVWVHAWSWNTFAAITLFLMGIWIFYQNTPVWDGFRESGELRKPAYAETVYQDSVFRTRSNTWSNLAYVIVGLYAVFLGIHDKRTGKSPESGYLAKNPAMSLLYGASCCYLGLGSGIFHASLTRWGQQLDVAAMYSPMVVLVGANIGRIIPEIWLGGRRVPSWPLLAVVVVTACVLLYIHKWSMSSGVVLPALILAVACGILPDFIRRDVKTRYRWLVFSFAALAVAVAFRSADIAKIVTGPDAWVQGHALWHLFTAAALACVYAYYRSERAVSAPQRATAFP